MRLVAHLPLDGPGHRPKHRAMPTWRLDDGWTDAT
ncbi:MAG: hypothetical protein QOE62_3177 [Actinomycetota bacterium]|nr:hypothetical protein [Actinomycetota bacterium]